LAGLPPGGVSIVGHQDVPAGARNSETKPEAGHAAKPASVDEEYWRGRARELREQMARLDAEIRDVKEEIRKLEAVELSLDRPITLGRCLEPQATICRSADWLYYSYRLKELQDQKEELRKRMDVLEEEARRAGAFPGWLR
jgi:chromosome segregation ATPase